MKYIPYSLTDLIRHDAFIAWVLSPDSESDAYWKGFLEQYPEKAKTVESAREYIFLLAEDTGRNRPSEAQSSKMWKVVEDSMYVEEQVPTAEVKPVTKMWQWLRVAASVVLICGIGLLSVWYFIRPNTIALRNNKKEAPAKQEAFKVTNGTDHLRSVILPDGSSVVLDPGSQLNYKQMSGGGKREVTLYGKAFFEIVKDTSRPFMVYSSGIVTKVLGTSFSVDAREKIGQVKVEVKTGKVTVFPVKDDATETEVSNAEKRGFVLYPDQRIALVPGTGKVLKQVETAVREPNQQDISTLLFVFDETPVSEVFKALEEAYHVKITCSVEELKKCPLTATLVGQPFSKKLAVICNAIDATYEINGDQVKITGNGCN
jgi:transmembrane sensor